MFDARNGNNRHLYRAMRKYGIENFRFIVSIKNVPVDQLDHYERLWIAKLDTINPEYGYNLSPGGMVLRGADNPMYGKTPWNKGIRRSDLERQHMREGQALIKEKKSLRMRGENNPMYHHVYTEDERKKISDSVRGEKNGFYGKHHSDYTKQLLKQIHSIRSKPVDMIDPQSGEVINHFDSVHEAARYINEQRGSTNADKSFIARCASGMYRTAYGFKWKFSERCND